MSELVNPVSQLGFLAFNSAYQASSQFQLLKLGFMEFWMLVILFLFVKIIQHSAVKHFQQYQIFLDVRYRKWATRNSASMGACWYWMRWTREERRKLTGRLEALNRMTSREHLLTS